MEKEELDLQIKMAEEDLKTHVEPKLPIFTYQEFLDITQDDIEYLNFAAELEDLFRIKESLGYDYDDYDDYDTGYWQGDCTL